MGRTYRRDHKGRFTSGGGVPSNGPGSVKWAKSSILIRQGTKRAKKARIVRIYQPKEIPDHIAAHFAVPKSGRLASPTGSVNSKNLKAQYISFLKGHKLRGKGHG